MNRIKEKIAQVAPILNDLGIDCWMVFCRETSIMADPILSLMVSHDVVWPSCFLYTGQGDSIAIVGHFDRADFIRSGNFTEVISYTESPRPVIVDTLHRLDPRSIALNYSKDNPSADGISHGMYLTLCEYLKGTELDKRLVSGEDICALVKSRKSKSEIANIEAAAKVAERAWKNALPIIQCGMTEKQIAAVIREEFRKLGTEESFGTIVNAGSKTEPGHGSPTDAVLEPGDLLHIDFGAKINGYCSDLQRLAYFQKPGETGAPEQLAEAFAAVRDIIVETGRDIRPGKTGFDLDSMARRRLTGAGYVEYPHALGHQLGQYVHDGGALLGPHWEQYGSNPDKILEADFAFTIELEILLETIGCVGLEEDVIITPEGARFLCPPQTELVVKR